MPRVWLPGVTTPERASRIIRERVRRFPDCRSWPELQKACAEHGVELAPARDERPKEEQP